MHIAHILPVNNEDITVNQPYIMALAHLVKQYPHYRDALRRCNADRYIILDNSIIETGEACDLFQLAVLADLCCADEIVLPDVFRNGEATFRLVQQSIEQLDKDGMFHGKRMAVVHGTDIHEWVQYFNLTANCDGVDVIGIPKVVCEWTDDGTRRELVEYAAKHTDKPIHLLGVYGTFKEFEGMPISAIRSVDTSLGALLCSQYKPATYDRENLVPRTLILDTTPISLIIEPERFDLIKKEISSYVERVASRQTISRPSN